MKSIITTAGHRLAMSTDTKNEVNTPRRRTYMKTRAAVGGAISSMIPRGS